MAVIPVTYIQFIIWLALVVIRVGDSETTDLVIKLIAWSFGFVSGAYSIAGETWVYVSSTGTFSSVTFNDGIGLAIGTTMIIGSFAILWVTYQNFTTWRTSRKKKYD